jgi:stress response protein YsnF
VEKRLRLKERWVITKRRVETPGTQSVTLRREEAVIEQLKPDGGADNPPPTAG